MNNKFRFKEKRTTPAPWQVRYAYIGFEGKSGGKIRPVLVTETDGQFCTIMEITGKSPLFSSDIPITDLNTAGLRMESTIQVQKTKTVPKASLRTCLGTLSYRDRNNVKNVIKRREFFK